ncbi:hypothetical protein [Paenibacillus kobensis]|uniref:hypothetical protein n=1 Tax=Paenibacillus kobensis TaxID=59841 RepID=UPI000FD84C49|nr:hypothetical protein [Paenibacillus kobensis]
MTRTLFKLFTITFILIMLQISTVQASHPYNPERHIPSIHSSTDGESFCVDVKNTSRVTYTTAMNTLTTVLYNTDDGWDELNNGKISFVGHSSGQNCSDMTSTLLSIYKFRYYVLDNPEDFSGGTSAVIDCSTNCVKRYGPTSVSGHTHYDYGHAYLKHTAISTTTTHTINHETGHLLGLIDGDGTCTPTSIMHSVAYGCTTNPAWPTTADINSVIAESNKS